MLLSPELAGRLRCASAAPVLAHALDRLSRPFPRRFFPPFLSRLQRKNIEHWIGHPNFSFFQHDVVNEFYIECDQIYHLACPASPPHYMYNPVKVR